VIKSHGKLFDNEDDDDEDVDDAEDIEDTFVDVELFENKFA